MAHKSIADTILMELKKEKEETVEKNKDLCLNFIQNVFDIAISNFLKCTADQGYLFPGGYNSLPIPTETFVSVSESLGFKIVLLEDSISFFVPKHEKSKKMTPAQKMLFNHVIAFNKKTRDFNHSVQTEANRIWESIKNRDFISKDNNDGTFTLSIPLILNSFEGISDKAFVENRDSKILGFLSSRAFPNATINDNRLDIVLGKKEN